MISGVIEGKRDVAEAVSELVGSPVRVVGRQPVSGGSINRTSVLTFDTGLQLFLKENSGRHEGLFAAEAEGLALLHAGPGPAVPKPLALYQSADIQYLALEYIERGSRAPDFWESFGRSLAELHRRNGVDRFGLASDNHIGRTPQINTFCDTWCEFFARHRLGYQIRLAERQGVADRGTVAAVMRIIETLDRYLPEPEQPSLLHGDLWGGNFMIGPDGHAVLIDPAVYYGHREADLAMTELFGGFSPQFAAAYNEAWPLDDGYGERVELYNLYHLLNHLNMFGSSYLGSVRSIAQRYAR